MSRVERIGDAALYLGDCREIARIAFAGCQVIVSDPPYSIPHEFGAQNRPDGSHRTLSWEWDKAISAKEIIGVFDDLFCRAVSAFVFCGLRQATPLAEAAARGGLVDKMAAWVKPYPPPPAPGNWWPSAFELAVYGYRSGAYFGDKRPDRRNVFHYDALRHGNGEKLGHPTQKPVALMQRIVSAVCHPEARVFDPFMGSGTTGIAALRLGRKFVGIEIEERWFDIACRRIEAEARQGRLDFDEHADALGSYHDAVKACGERHKAGEPLGDFFLPLRRDGR